VVIAFDHRLQSGGEDSRGDDGSGQLRRREAVKQVWGKDTKCGHRDRTTTTIIGPPCQAEQAEYSTMSSGIASPYESLASESSTLVDCLKTSSLCCFGGRSWGEAMRGKIRADLPLPSMVTDNSFGQGRREAYRTGREESAFGVATGLISAVIRPSRTNHMITSTCHHGRKSACREREECCAGSVQVG
jgi:hypothetical protein